MRSGIDVYLPLAVDLVAVRVEVHQHAAAGIDERELG
jgi:hypothetical protein